MFQACHQFQYSSISFNVKSKETAINLVNRTKILFCDDVTIRMVLVYFWIEKIRFK